MKRLLIGIILFTLIFSCSDMETVTEIPTSSVPIELGLNTVGIRLASNFVTTEAKMNVRLESADKVTIKIVDLSGKTVSSETVEAKAGDKEMWKKDWIKVVSPISVEHENREQ